MELDIQQLISDLKSAASDILQKDVTTVRGFSERQIEALAKHAALVTRGLAEGSIGADLKDFFIDNLEDMALNFARTLRGLLMVTIEKVWNALSEVLTKAVETAISAVL